MKVLLTRSLFFSILFFVLAMSPLLAHARRATFNTMPKSFNSKKISSFHPKKTYTQKTAYAGMGKPSKVNGLSKTKPISGYYKPSKGYKYINSYARSR